MPTPLLLVACALLGAPPAALPARAPALLQSEFDQQLAQAGEDVARLWELHESCRSEQKYTESRRVLKRIVELDPEHERAREALGHVRYDGQWFESSYKLAEYKRAEEERKRVEEGVVRLGEQWVDAADAPFLRMGWTKLEDGEWIGPLEKERRDEAARLSAEGWRQQTDLVWVPPGEFERWQEGLWKVDDQWLDAAAASAHHARVGQEWRWPTQYFLLHTTVHVDGLATLAEWVDRTYRDLARFYGLQPKRKPVVTILNGGTQYNQVATGDQASLRPPAESNGWSSCHYAFVGESWFDLSRFDPQQPGTPLEYLGGGIAFWDRDDASLAPFGQYAVRFAAGLSYAEAIDPSWEAVSRFVANPTPQGQVAGFWGEKKLPLWIRYGVASYVDRFARDPRPAEGFHEWSVRDWALDNVRRQGGLRPLAEVFALSLDPNRPDEAGKRIAEAGMLISFVLDGDCAPVKQAHAALRAALRSGEGVAERVRELEEAIAANEEQLHYHVRM